MGTTHTENQRDEAPVAAFDFDGTLTTHDSFKAFLRWRAGAAGYAVGMVRLAPAAVAWLAHRDRGRLKAAMVRVFLRGIDRGALEAEADRFAAQAAPSLLRPDAVERWERWRAAGARVVIVTASPDILVEPFARLLGAHAILGTRLRYDDQGRVLGPLDGANCRGAEKVRRLREAFGPDLRLAAAYGDTAGDHEMLAIADEAGLRVFTGAPDR